MDSVPRSSTRLPLLITLGVVAVLCGLAAHLVADITCGSPDLLLASQSVRGNSLAGLQFATCSLLAILALPTPALVAISLTRVFPLNDARLTRLIWFSLPPVHPPIALC